MSTSMVATASVVCASNSSILAGGGGTKTLSLTYPHTEKLRGVKSDEHGGQAIVFLHRIHDDWQDF
jgi:hypothetical protein